MINRLSGNGVSEVFLSIKPREYVCSSPDDISIACTGSVMLACSYSEMVCRNDTPYIP